MGGTLLRGRGVVNERRGESPARIWRLRMAPKCRCRDSFQIREGADGPLEVTVMLTVPCFMPYYDIYCGLCVCFLISSWQNPMSRSCHYRLIEEDAESWRGFRTVPVVPQEGHNLVQDTTPALPFHEPVALARSWAGVVALCSDPKAWG